MHLHQPHTHVGDGDGQGQVEEMDEGKREKHIYTINMGSFPRRPQMHWEKLHDTPPSSSSLLQPYTQPKSDETEKVDNSGKSHKMKSKSFADLAEVFGFGSKIARPSSRLSEILPRPKSSASLERRSCE
ncbi:hypothetical protein L486_03348 [Kwoniella mangroviensis CBS 10435]|uniref:Uncharacterized protein n=1 Tax=Kwoniella mangroviensis CBS 10435 TaxID=1331196 RepID=A0A1B9ITL5_9TREE|nr:uncharacterized protein I203_02034 [Kwoniella mangroviensis CBS 8507]OCF58857.1 hypothetical protein L486_03348 [Kwoniella mangroviensis CBS 10435]OCF68650.1 hypothetical protein I203_02034 [Kwoniella mangroviensis CBS 8507]